MVKRKATPKMYTLYPAQVGYIKALAGKRFDGNQSAALRSIINDVAQAQEPAQTGAAGQEAADE